MIAEIEAEAVKLKTAIAEWDRRFKDLSEKLRFASIELANAASDSWIGYQSTVYFDQFQTLPSGAEFDSFSGVGSPRHAWREYSYQEFLDELVGRAGTSTAALDPLATAAAEVTLVLLAVRDEVLSSLDALLVATPDRRLEELRGQLVDVRAVFSQGTKLGYDEFNREPAAGKHTVRLAVERTLACGTERLRERAQTEAPRTTTNRSSEKVERRYARSWSSRVVHELSHDLECW